MASRDEKKLRWQAQVQLACDQIIPWYPKTILLIGSMARSLMGLDTAHTPRDIDLLVVGDNPLLDVKSHADELPIELHRYQTEEMVRIAYSLRYDARSVALSKLYGKNVIKQHSRDVIAAALLLGDTYNEFGIQQIDINGQIDQRNYAIHEVLYGKRWWQALRRYAARRRGLLGWVTDKVFYLDRFEGDER
jgi:hypothetical protein